MEDSEDQSILSEKYNLQKSNPNYQILKNKTTILGTWDDHDYDINDGGKEHTNKEACQEAFLNFIEAPKNDPRWNRPGVYHSYEYTANNIHINNIILDTRSFS